MSGRVHVGTSRRNWSPLIRGLWTLAVLAGGTAAFGSASKAGAAGAAPSASPAATESAKEAPHSELKPTKDTTAEALPSQACIGCHTFEGELSHPVGVTPKTKVPASMPLEMGKIACLTCHDGDAAQGHESKRTRGQSFLRDAGTVGTMCETCHQEGKSSAHATGYQWAHPGSTSVKKGAGIPDAESATCMSCHDGAIAKEPGLTMESRAFSSKGDHSVGAPFQSGLAPGEDFVKLVPKAGLDKRVRLFDDKVGCGSCHSVYSKHDKILVVSNRASALCLTCHAE